MNENDNTQEQDQDGNADQGSGARPESPEEATSPPGNPEVDEERVDDVEEDAERTAPY